MSRFLSIAFLVPLMAGLTPSMAQAPVVAVHRVRPSPPTRDPHTSGYVSAKECLTAPFLRQTLTETLFSVPRTIPRRR